MLKRNPHRETRWKEMKMIFKYPLQIYEHQDILLPVGNYKILSVHNQNEVLVLYALVETSTLQTRCVAVEIRGTGQPAEYLKGCTYVGTVEMYGTQMFHVFAEEQKE